MMLGANKTVQIRQKGINRFVALRKPSIQEAILFRLQHATLRV